jgi:aminocarboxymuconate-semialdehyde decarboxylase
MTEDRLALMWLTLPGGAVIQPAARRHFAFVAGARGQVVSVQQMKIDVHNHAIPEAVLELMRTEDVYRVQIRGGRVEGGNRVGYPLFESFYDPAAKLAELELSGLEAAVLSAAPPILYYEVSPEAGEAICRATNSGLAEYCRFSPERLRWMAHVPMQAPERAVAVLEQAAEAGCVGVEVGTSIAGRRLDEPGFEPVWDQAELLSLPVMIHPAYNQTHPALEPWYLQNVIGNPLETTIAIERLICAGVLDRHPQLTVILVHAGGFFPFQAGRLRHARTVRPELASAPPDPWAYPGQVVTDAITHDADALRYLVLKLGAENVVMGTDLPFDMATPHPMAALEEALGTAAARQVAEDNPARLFRFPA